MMENNFGNYMTRYLNIYLYNPYMFKHVTLLMDGHHNKITYEDIYLNKKELYSYKLNSNGLNTQFIVDMNNIVVNVSNSLPCKMNNDDNMFISDINMLNIYE